MLVLVALYNTIGLVFILNSPHLDPYFENLILEDVFHVVFQGKEVVVLSPFLVLAVHVNDYADDITTVLNSKPWGDLGSKEEMARLDLLFLTTVSSTTPEAAVSMWKSKTPKSQPILFKVCGIRPERDVFLAAMASLIGSVSVALLNSYVGYGRNPAPAS